MGEAVVGHAHEDAGGSGDAGQGAGEHADESAEVDEWTEEDDAGEVGEDARGRWMCRGPGGAACMPRVST